MSKDTHEKFAVPQCWNTTNKSHLNYEGGGVILFEGQSKHLPSESVERERIVRMVSRRYPDFEIVTRCPKCAKLDASSTMKFKVGDLVQSAPNSSDVKIIKDTWIAVIHKVVGENEHGGCYETVGRWAQDEPNEDLVLRQLWGTHLEARGGDA